MNVNLGSFVTSCQRKSVGQNWLFILCTSHSAVIPTDSYRPPDRPQVVNWEENALIDFDDLCNKYNSLQIFTKPTIYCTAIHDLKLLPKTINHGIQNHKAVERLGIL